MVLSPTSAVKVLVAVVIGIQCTVRTGLGELFAYLHIHVSVYNFAWHWSGLLVVERISVVIFDAMAVIIPINVFAELE